MKQNYITAPEQQRYPQLETSQQSPSIRQRKKKGFAKPVRDLFNKYRKLKQLR